MRRPLVPLTLALCLVALGCGETTSPVDPLVVTTTTLPAAVENEAYTTEVAAAGGEGGLTWRMATGSGDIPDGLTLSASGDITGTPSTERVWDFIVEVSSSDGQTAQQALSIAVAGAALTADFPAIPRPSSPSEEIPLSSDTIVSIVPNMTDLVVTVTEGYGSWEFHRQELTCRLTGWDPDPETVSTSEDVRSSTFSVSNRIRPWRLAFQEAGESIDPYFDNSGYLQGDTIVVGRWDPSLPRNFEYLGFGSWFTNSQTCDGLLDVGNNTVFRFYYITDSRRISNPVYLKRERYWERVPVDGDAAMFASVDPGTTFEVDTEYTTGISIAESTTYATTLSTEIGFTGGGGPVPAAIESKVSESVTFSWGTERTMTEEYSVSVSESVVGRDGYERIFMIWELVEKYSVVDADGNPYTDPSFTFDLSDAVSEVRGVAIKLATTDFP